MSLPLDNLSINDFLEDESFQIWMRERRPADRLYWQQWLIQHPEKENIYEQAVAAFLVIEGNKQELPDWEIAEKARKMLELMPDVPAAEVKPLWSRNWWSGAVAAAVVIIGLFICWQFEVFSVNKPNRLTNRKEEKQLEADQWEVVNNTMNEPKVVLLPDNSSVVLSAGSRLRFRKETTAELREVFLEGEAFFEVAKDAAKPFFVYTNALTAKVLGTSFQVRSFTDEETVFVNVKTGKVVVTSVSSPEKSVLLIHKQQLSLETKTDTFLKEENKIADESVATVANREFTYDYVPVADIFDQLASVYHLPIQYDRELLQSCTFTGQLNDMPLPEKIRLICLTIESDFEIIDNQVIVHSRGCH
ncbi:FecR family protein [Runella sp.]|uniref:FecR family protein n=1 Tax=Runella sp. TaxID=1960881 RepID=UPI003D0B6E64